MNFVVLMGRMTLIDRDVLLDWLEDEAAEILGKALDILGG